MKRKFLVLLTALPLLLTGCVKEEIADSGSNYPEGEIHFSVGFESGSRVATDDDFASMFEDGDKIGIFAVRHAAGIPSEPAEADNYIHNARLNYNGTTWNFDAGEKFFFPTNGDRLDFYAYYPYDEDADDPTAIMFEAMADQSSGNGFNLSHLLAVRSMDVPRSTGPVALNLSQLFSIVQVKLADHPVLHGTNVTVDAAFSGARTQATLDLGAASGPAAQVDGTAAATDVKMWRVEQPGDPDYDTGFTFRAMVPAQTLDPGLHFRFTVGGRNIDMDIRSFAQENLEAGRVKLYGTSAPATLWDGVSTSEPADWKGGNPVGGIIRIYTAAELAWVSMMTNRTDGSKTDFAGKTLRLMNDIDLGSFPWKPMGDESAWTGSTYVFGGIFDGSGHKIANLYIDNATSDVEGLFGKCTAGSTIKDLHISSGSVNARFYTGSLCGINMGTIEGCSNAATVNEGFNVGGVCGYNNGPNAKIIACHNSGAVSGTGENVGGVCGENVGKIENCSNAAKVSGGSRVGSVCGYNNGPNAKITACQNSGEVSGTGDNVGGVCGENRGQITGSQNSGAVSGTGDNVGGACGFNNNGTITACRNIGNVRGIDYVGGVCGYNNRITTACYNTGTVSGTTYVGGVSGINYNNVSVVRACYSIGAVSGTGDNVGGACGFNNGPIDCYWANHAIGIGGGIDTPQDGWLFNIAQFGSPPSWPSDIDGWSIGDGSGKYWKTLGGWNDGDPVFPKLYFE